MMAERQRVKERDARLRQEKEERARADRAAKAQRAKEEREQKAALEESANEEAKRAEQAAQARELKGQVQEQVLTEMDWNNFWAGAAQNEVVKFVLGVFFFVLFYYGVIVNVKKRRKDYEDRLKLEKAADEERKRLREWEEEMQMLEDGGLEDLDSAKKTKGSGKGKEAEKKKGEGEDGEISKEEEKRLADAEAEKNPLLAASKRFMRSGASVRAGRRGKRRPPQYLDLGAEVRFSDVAGLGLIREELEEVVEFFMNKEKYRRRGANIPAGILLCGDPGTGKTLLAKAVAGEAGVNFFSISASQFVEIYVGVGASRVRALYNEAAENAPAVVFIDELDAVGRRRGMTEGSGGQERDNTLNQLLTCLDGFEGRGNIVTIAATNRIDVLDPALIRPGRFDRKIFIPKPSSRGRVDILKVHASGKPMADDVDYVAVAEATPGMSGAQLANILDSAALRVLRDGRTEMTTEDLMEAVLLEAGGYPSPHARSEEHNRLLAMNVAVLTAMAWEYSDLAKIKSATIIPRMGEEKGLVRIKADEARVRLGGISRQTFLDLITVHLAPRLADWMWNGEEKMTTIWADSAELARSTARQLVLQGLSERPDYLYGMREGRQDRARREAVDEEAKKILEECTQRAVEKLRRNRSLIDALVEALMEKKTLNESELSFLVEQFGDFDGPAPGARQIRERQVEEFRERMIAEAQRPRELTSSANGVAGEEEEIQLIRR
eukprot:TRINITY_DN17041_c0_g1_i1.p1 TRINITY_DN17041_c0_g1~~TRINITY_DN17041_c0_g1_i1.p1  ORF type:complete len:802 (+),score=195.80 TRINITY_DN17041_c0_g1_i1:238-2406(+)